MDAHKNRDASQENFLKSVEQKIEENRKISHEFNLEVFNALKEKISSVKMDGVDLNGRAR